jgi:imidazolonepropionase-like amidohydrolase
VVEEATNAQRYVTGHAYTAAAVNRGLELGVRCIEHGNLLDEPTAQLMAERDAVLVPTLVTYDAMDRRSAEIGMNPVSRSKNAEVLDSGRKAVQVARVAGVAVGFGTDLMGKLEDEQLSGLRLQADVDGIVRVLQSATRVNATLIGRPDLGVIEPGAIADLVILPGNVLDDPSLLWGESRTVIQGGSVIEA